MADLLGDKELAERFEGGSYATLYLSPKDYHRFHTPMPGRFLGSTYFPGTLWPVNQAGINGVDRLFVQNERIVSWMELDVAEQVDLCLVPVGATCVGKIQLTFDTLTTNEGKQDVIRKEYEEPPFFERGQEFGRFLFGSTIVMFLHKDAGELECKEPGTSLRLFEPIGKRTR